MDFESETKTVGDLVELYRAEVLKANPEYQRGIVWSQIQQRKLIDSVMRGYPLPLIYLHYTSRIVAGMKSEGFEVIDGQQRIRSLYEFAEGAFKLLDPIKDEKKAKFPAFIKDQPSPWAGHDIHSLPDNLKKQFFDTPLAVARIQTGQSNEVRDLFVRLQSGLPLNSQETRDAWPGQFTEFILWLGGKPGIARYPGHPFFTRVLRMNSPKDRGKARQLAAQVSMLFLTRRWSGDLSDINSEALNDFYYENLDFDSSGVDAKRLVTILDKIDELIDPKKLPKLHGHDAIHLILLVDSLWDDYAPDWEGRLARALDKFQAKLLEAKATKDSANPDPYWLQYGQWTRVNSDRGARIALRHRFYLERMAKFLAPLTLKDSRRCFGEIERAVLYYRQHKQCLQCLSIMNWSDCEVHHVMEHSKGGPTNFDNGAAVHKQCHPKGKAATDAFAKKFQRYKQSPEAYLFPALI
jgi:5-methylcytosine-specific restriction endonuclease McrA